MAWTNVVIGGAVGLVIGALVGYVGKCRSGVCPLTSNPYSGAVVGAIFGALIGLTITRGPSSPGEPPAKKESPMTQPTTSVTMKGKPVTLVGRSVEVGQAAPDFVAVDTDLKDVRLSHYRGKVVLLLSVPSLDTSVCSRETHRFNESAASLGKDVAILVVSMDLPFAQKRWCGAEGVSAVRTLSDHRQASFGEAYGVLIGDMRLLARAVFVVGRDGKVTYKELVPEVSSEPDYSAALHAVAQAVKA
jgi:thiol peroxidase